MSIFSRLFSFSKKQNNSSAPDIRFGRYTDAYKTEAQQAAWLRALQRFEEQQPLEAYRCMLEFMRDDALDNVLWTEDEKGLHFEFRQGSRRVTGQATAALVRVESRIAWVDEQKVGFMRRLVEMNYKLRYARYALTPDNCLAIVFDSSTRDGSPFKLVQAFMELSINADKQDDILIEEFKTLRPVAEATHTIPLPDNERKIKVKYLRSEIADVMAALEQGQPDPNRYPGGYVYLLLGTAFRLDYLVRPEGTVMDLLEKVFRTYFTKDDRNPATKVEAMKKLFQRITERSDETLAAELYDTVSTFGINPSSGHDRIQSLLDSELPKVNWHIEQKHPEILQMSILRYAVGYALYHCTPPPPDRDLLHLFFRITEHRFFTDLGYKENFRTPDYQLNKQAIEQEIKRIVQHWGSKYPKLRPNLAILDYTALPLFARSYLMMVRGLDLA
jgi:hypothetical protein